MLPTVAEECNRISHLSRTFHRFETETKSRQTRLGIINGTIRRLLIRLQKMDRIKDEDRDTITRVQKQGYDLVDDIEKKLEGHGLVRVVGKSKKRTRGRGWDGLQNSRLAVEDLQAVAKEQTEQWSGALRRSKRIAKKSLQDVKRNQHKIADVDIWMSDDDDCIITLVIDRAKKAAEDRVENPIVDEDEDESESENEDDTEFDDDHFPTRNYIKEAEQRQVVNEIEVDREQKAEESKVELGLRLKDELLWYDCSKDFDEDLLP